MRNTRQFHLEKNRALNIVCPHRSSASAVEATGNQIRVGEISLRKTKGTDLPFFSVSSFFIVISNPPGTSGGKTPKKEIPICKLVCGHFPRFFRALFFSLCVRLRASITKTAGWLFFANCSALLRCGVC